MDQSTFIHEETLGPEHGIWVLIIMANSSGKTAHTSRAARARLRILARAFAVRILLQQNLINSKSWRLEVLFRIISSSNYREVGIEIYNPKKILSSSLP